MQVSPTKAVKLFKISKPTLYQDMKSGKISFSKNSKGKRQIDTAELSRVYESRVEEGSDGVDQKPNQITPSNTNEQNKALSDREKELLEKEVRMLKEQSALKDKMIEDWQDAFNKAQKTADKITALIEHANGGNTDNTKVSDLERKVEDLMAQNKKFLDLETKRESARAKRRQQEQERRDQALQEEQNKGFFQKLFG